MGRPACDYQGMASTLTAGEVARYSRHLILPEIGIAGQERLKAARVLCIGAGGLGSPAALYLAAAGVGTLTLVDFDHVELTNLQRQILHGTADVGRSKLESARDRLASLNPEVQVDRHPSPFAAANAPALVSSHDVVIDGSDNFPTRYLVNDACVLAGTAECLRQHRPVRGSGIGLRGARRPLLPVPASGAPAPRSGPELRGRGGARRSAGRHRDHPGDGGDQADPPGGQAPDRPVPGVRRPQDAISRAEAEKGPGLPCLRDASDHPPGARVPRTAARPGPTRPIQPSGTRLPCPSWRCGWQRGLRP